MRPRRELHGRLAGRKACSTRNWSKWRNRPLGRFVQVILDARYEKVRHGGAVRDCALLDGHRHRRERQALRAGDQREPLGGRGSLAHVPHLPAGSRAARRRADHQRRPRGPGRLRARHASPGVPWQRCQFHLQQNAQSYVPRKALKRQGGRRAARRLQRHRPRRRRPQARSLRCHLAQGRAASSRAGPRRTSGRASPCSTSS